MFVYIFCSYFTGSEIRLFYIDLWEPYMYCPFVVIYTVIVFLVVIANFVYSHFCLLDA